MHEELGREAIKYLLQGSQGQDALKYYQTVTSVTMIIKCMTTKKVCEIRFKSNQHLWWKQNFRYLADQYPKYRDQKCQLFIPKVPCFVYLSLVCTIFECNHILYDNNKNVKLLLSFDFRRGGKKKFTTAPPMYSRDQCIQRQQM